VQPMLMAARQTGEVMIAKLRAQLTDVPVLSFLEIPETKAVDVIAVIGGQHAAALPNASQNGDQ
jgi:flagellar biosynthesis protein FlhA